MTESRAEIELVGDGDGIAVFGDAAVVERFLAEAGVESRPLRVRMRAGSTLAAAAGAAHAGSTAAVASGRWIRLTAESARALDLGTAMQGSAEGLSRTVVMTQGGKISKILEYAKPGSARAVLTSPAMLAGAAGVMAQLALQQTIAEITDYLAVIDAKVDDVLRAQNDTVIAKLVSVGETIDGALLRREHVGRVSDVTWSSLHGAAATINEAQNTALLRLARLAEKLEHRKLSALAQASARLDREITEWLAVLARCFQLQDARAVLELDRVLDDSPADIDGHRSALREERELRRERITEATRGLLERIEAAADTANERVLLHPTKAGAVVRSGNRALDRIADFEARIGIERDRPELEARPWRAAAADAREAVTRTAGAGAAATARAASRSLATIGAAASGAASTVADRLRRTRAEEPEPEDGGAHEPGRGAPADPSAE
ncbi:MAG: hypothetical protein GXX90_07625 [Microbacteriaceae bacterium]|nr:hypothetical protein [Microbacteriaceae bacterium]